MGDEQALTGRVRARDLGIRIGLLEPGPGNAITDVSGVRVGHCAIREGAGPLHIGQGPIRTGVTVVIPHDRDSFSEAVFAGAHRLNGNGELTGLEWIREAGLLTSPAAAPPAPAAPPPAAAPPAPAAPPPAAAPPAPAQVAS